MLFTISLFAIGSFAVPHFAHAAIPFFGPIIPSAQSACPAGWGLFMIVVNNLIELGLTIAIVFIAPLTIAYAGFLYVVNPIDPSGIGKAKSILTNTIVGIVIALAAWMIVDAVMAALYNKAAMGATWSSLIGAGGDQLCLPQTAAPTSTSVSTNNVSSVTNGTLSSGTGACDANVVQSAAKSAGYDLSTSEANTLACIAKPESTCGASNINYNWGKGSSAVGAFQVTLQGNSSCYDNSVCQGVVGASGSLNCASGFSGGNPKTDAASQAIVSQCVTAASNTNCSAAAAACVLKKQGFSAWTADKNSSAQGQCISANS